MEAIQIGLFMIQIVALILLFFYVNKILKLNDEFIEYIGDMKRIIENEYTENKSLKGQPLHNLIKFMIRDMATHRKRLKDIGDTARNSALTISVLREEKESLELQLEKEKANRLKRRRHMGSLYSQIAYRDKIIAKHGIKIKKKQSKYCNFQKKD